MFDASRRPKIVASEIEFVEQVAQLGQHLEHGLAPDLGRVRRDHRAHLQRRHGGNEIVGGDAGASHAGEYGVEASRTWRVVAAVMETSPSFEMDVLGGVGEQRQPVERSQHQDLLVEWVLRQRSADVVDTAATGSPCLDGNPADLLDEFVDRTPVGPLDRIAQQAPEQPDVVTDGIVALLERVIGDVGQVRGVGHLLSQSEPARRGNPDRGHGVAPD